MTTKGIEITCSGCGAITFMDERVGWQLLRSTKDITKVVAYDKDQSESWVKVHQTFDLCPKCAKIHEKMLCKFYEECGKEPIS